MSHSPFGLFEVFGIEIEYMIVDLKTLAPLPASDAVLRDASGHVVSDVEDGYITWSNELAAHVIELKTTQPVHTLERTASEFHRSLLKVDQALRSSEAGLLPSAMHPLLSPSRDVKLWAHENTEIYGLYDQLFGSGGHGWTNLQSMHLNLPFNGSDEFGRLHASARFALPLLPALAASSPIEEGKLTPELDRRLVHYRLNQARIPSITGLVIPEPAWTPEEYERKILRPIYADIGPHDPEGLLQHEWLNSRGAIARFERDAIEIRVLDSQESPSCDIAIAKATSNIIAALAFERLASQAVIRSFQTDRLAQIFDRSLKFGGSGRIDDSDYVTAFGGNDSIQTFRDLIDFVLQKTAAIEGPCPLNSQDERRLQIIVGQGSLSERIRATLDPNPTEKDLVRTYLRLRECMLNNEAFV